MRVPLHGSRGASAAVRQLRGQSCGRAGWRAPWLPAAHWHGALPYIDCCLRCACRLDSTLAEQRVLDTLVAKYRGEVERLQRECAQAEDQVVHLRDQLQVRSPILGGAQAAATPPLCSLQPATHQMLASSEVLLWCSWCWALSTARCGWALKLLLYHRHESKYLYAPGRHTANPPQTRTGAVQDTQRREEAAASSLSYVAADAEALRRESDLLRQHLRAVGDNNTQLQRALQQASTELRVLQTSRWPSST